MGQGPSGDLLIMSPWSRKGRELQEEGQRKVLLEENQERCKPEEGEEQCLLFGE